MILSYNSGTVYTLTESNYLLIYFYGESIVLNGITISPTYYLYFLKASLEEHFTITPNGEGSFLFTHKNSSGETFLQDSTFTL